MKKSSFPGCCVASVLSGFGNAGQGTGKENEHLSVEELKTEIHKKLKYMTLSAFLSCTTNDRQVKVNKALKEMGFKHSKWMSKKQHPETRVRLWWISIQEYKDGKC